MKKKNYLSNENILEEIHKSKNSYCWFADPVYRKYDLIVDEKSDHNDDHLVYRVMCNDHIPFDRSNTRRNAGYVATNFRPFKHVCDGKLVGLSHWNNNEFSQDHGRLTDGLARILMLLVERYALRPNWRGYSFVEDFKSSALIHLCQVALRFDESKSKNPFSFYTQCVYNNFLRELKTEKNQTRIRNEILMACGGYTTTSHQIDNQVEQRLPKKRGRPPKKKDID